MIAWRQKTQARAQDTIRGVPPEVDQALRKKAARLKQTLNQVVIEELTRARTGRVHKPDFSILAGKWTPNPAFDSIIAARRQIDSDKWK